MKRRNADCGKLRRIKRNKIAEGMYGSNTLLYVKFLILWAIIIMADYMLEFRFEFLWPFWLLLRSVHDSFKYKGLTFSVLFVCIVITSDLVCLFFIPVHWLFFAASTYVWVQYVWHTDKGICLPTIILWMLFVYLEAAIRWKDSRHIPHLDLCRPFAAHCIGYPVVTLGFGFKSYVGYRIRQRKQREVAKENEFYMQLLQQALPQDDKASDDTKTQNDQSQEKDQHSNQAVTLAAISSSSHNTHNNSLQNNIHKNTHLKLLNASMQNTNSSANHTMSTAATAAATTTITTQCTTIPNGVTHSNSMSTQKNNRRSSDKDKSDISSGSARSLDLSNSSKAHISYHQNHHSYKDSNKSLLSSNDSTLKENTWTGLNHVHHSREKEHRKESTEKDASSKNTNQFHECHNNISSKSNDCKAVVNNKNMTSNASESFHLKHETSKFNNYSVAEAHYIDGMNSGNSNSCSSSNSSGSNNNKEKHSKAQMNGGIVMTDMELSQQTHNEFSNTEIIEKTKGKRNRIRMKDTKESNHITFRNSNDNLHQHYNQANCNNHTLTSTTTPTLLSAPMQRIQTTGHRTRSNDSGERNGTDLAISSEHTQLQHIETAICESCIRLENELKKLKADCSHFKQVENDLRQKVEANSSFKNSLHAKQKEFEELDKRIQDMVNSRQIDRQNMQNSERRLGEERRQRQSLESALNSERKQRKHAEEKAIRMECGEICKQKKLQLDAECKQLRHDLNVSEELRKNVEQKSRNYEQELRQFEVEFRNREAREGTEVLMSALAAMQEKNTTLEKNLSAETRVKLDLFSALGEAKRQLEIRENIIRNKDKEVLDLKAKIAQLLAVMPAMPNESFCMAPCSTATSSLLRINDGTSSTLQSSAAQMSQHISLGGSPLISQLQNLGVFTSTATNTMVPHSPNNTSNQSQQQQQQQGAGSQLDPNATAYTPKNLVSGTEA